MTSPQAVLTPYKLRASMCVCRSAEQLWFESHPEYAEVSKQCGVGNLARRINVILGNHIRLMLPTLRRQITEALEAKTAELKEYGPPLDLDSESARWVMGPQAVL